MFICRHHRFKRKSRDAKTSVSRRRFLIAAAGAVSAASVLSRSSGGEETESAKKTTKDLRIVELRVTPIALPDPPLLASGGCHGPYFLRNVIELQTDDGIRGIAETHGGQEVTDALNQSGPLIVGQSAWSYRRFGDRVRQLRNDCYAGIELACLDAIGRATGRRLCELLGGPVREQVEFAAYLFYRFAADHPAVLTDPRLVELRGRGDQALDRWGEVRTPDAMADLAARFREKWGFRVLKLKGGVLPPDEELATLRAIHSRVQGKCLLRIDPNGRWTTETALRIGKQLQHLPLEYYEDPVVGQLPMAEVRQKTGLKMSTNMCVTQFEHIPDAIRNGPIDVVLGDHHGWGGLTAFQMLGQLTDSIGWGLSQHSNNHAGITMAAMIHAGAVTPQLTYASDTHYVWLPDGSDVIEGPNLKIANGFMTVPSGPGLGVSLDRDKLARASEVYQKCGIRDRDDAATMQRFQPGWEKKQF
jgi:glucarate dehydratase